MTEKDQVTCQFGILFKQIVSGGFWLKSTSIVPVKRFADQVCPDYGYYKCNYGFVKDIRCQAFSVTRDPPHHQKKANIETVVCSVKM